MAEQVFHRGQFVAWGKQGAAVANARMENASSRRVAMARARNIATVAYIRAVDPTNSRPVEEVADLLARMRGEAIKEGLRRRRERHAAGREATTAA